MSQTSNQRVFNKDEDYFAPLDGKTIPACLAILNSHIEGLSKQIEDYQNKIDSLKAQQSVIQYLSSRIFSAASEQDMVEFAKNTLYPESSDPLAQAENKPAYLTDEQVNYMIDAVEGVEEHY